ncbi:hypothetical protein AB3466_09140 [Sphingobacterium thalpophilum]|nr:hypothetical protein [Sphingobacterium thalpophilum]
MNIRHKYKICPDDESAIQIIQFLSIKNDASHKSKRNIMGKNVKIGYMNGENGASRDLFVLMDTDEVIDSLSSDLLEITVERYILIHDQVERLDELALALENAGKEVLLARNINELNVRGIGVDQLEQMVIKILK